MGTLMTLGFIVVAGWVLLAANGYVVNLRSLTIEQRALISLAGSPAQVHITLDGQRTAEKLPAVLRTILPGHHTVRISAAGYQDWQLSARLDSGQALVRDAILLFRTEPLPRALPDGAPVTAIPTVDPSLSINGGEVFVLAGSQQTLVTRFSQPVLAARLSSDRAHVFLQLGNQLFVTELDGANTTLLITLDTATPAILVPSEHDSLLTVATGATVRAWQIR